MTIESVLATLYRHVSTSSSSLKLAQPIFRINNSFSNALSTLRIMGQRSSTLRKVQLQGTCDEKFLPVKEQLQKMLEKGGEEHVQLCVYVDGECVIDLYGSAKENTNYDADKVQNVFSSGKTLECIVIALLADQGILKFDDKITKFWPEFGQNGKDDVTINDVLKHESGLAWFTESIPIKNLWTENIKENKTGQIIEKQGLHFIKDAPERNGSKVEYHAITRGAIINEVVRRADPKGRTMDEIIREDIGIDGIFVALKESEKARSVKVNQPSMNDLLKKALNPANSDVKLGDLLRLMKFFKGALGGGDPTQAVFAAEQASNPMALDIHANDDAFAKAEVSSCFAQANARGLAKLASKMADKDGGFISKEVWNDMHSEPDLKYFGVFPEGPLRVNFTKGGLNYFKDFEKNLSLADEILNKGRNGYYGWFGYGGSVLQWNPELKIGFAFCPTYLNYMELSNARGAKLQGIVADCCK